MAEYLCLGGMEYCEVGYKVESWSRTLDGLLTEIICRLLRLSPVDPNGDTGAAATAAVRR